MCQKTTLFIILLSCVLGLAKGSCLQFGHSCWGAHGKRASSPPGSQDHSAVKQSLPGRWAYIIKEYPEKLRLQNGREFRRADNTIYLPELNPSYSIQSSDDVPFEYPQNSDFIRNPNFNHEHAIENAKMKEDELLYDNNNTADDLIDSGNSKFSG